MRQVEPVAEGRPGIPGMVRAAEGGAKVDEGPSLLDTGRAAFQRRDGSAQELNPLITTCKQSLGAERAADSAGLAHRLRDVQFELDQRTRLLVGHTLIVRADSTLQNISDADKPGIRIASGTNAPHTAPLAAYLKQAQLVKIDETAGISMLKAGQVDAYASGRFVLVKTASQDPSLRVLEGDFFVAKLGVAVSRVTPRDWLTLPNSWNWRSPPGWCKPQSTRRPSRLSPWPRPSSRQAAATAEERPLPTGGLAPRSSVRARWLRSRFERQR